MRHCSYVIICSHLSRDDTKVSGGWGALPHFKMVGLLFSDALRTKMLRKIPTELVIAVVTQDKLGYN